MIKLQDITFRDLKDIARLTSQYSVMKYIGDGRTWDFKKVKKFILLIIVVQTIQLN